MTEFVLLRQHPELALRAEKWFHEKWGIPQQAYHESIDACLRGENSIPQWYLMMENDEIIAGVGCIENDFHERKDLAPNLCAVYVETQARGKGVARWMLNAACDDLKALGVPCVYLLTDHVGFYEKCGFEFFDFVKGSDGDTSRMYRRRL